MSEVYLRIRRQERPRATAPCEDTLGGKGAGLSRDEQGRRAGPAGLYDFDCRSATSIFKNGNKVPRRIDPEGDGRSNCGKLEKADGAEARRTPREPPTR